MPRKKETNDLQNEINELKQEIKNAPVVEQVDTDNSIENLPQSDTHPTPTPTPTPTPVPEIDKELIMRIRNEIDAEYDRKLKEVISQLSNVQQTNTSANPNTEIDYGNVRNYTIPETDKIRDKHGNITTKTYISPNRGFVFGVYEKDGSYCYSPYKRPIQFRNAVFDKGKSGNANDIVHFSTFSTWSQKESDYIESSPFFGKIIFDSVTQARTVKPEILNAIARSTSYIAGLKEGDLLAMAKRYGMQNKTRSEIKEFLSKVKLQEILDAENDARGRALEKFAEAYKKDE